MLPNPSTIRNPSAGVIACRWSTRVKCGSAPRAARRGELIAVALERLDPVGIEQSRRGEPCPQHCHAVIDARLGVVLTGLYAERHASFPAHELEQGAVDELVQPHEDRQRELL